LKTQGHKESQIRGGKIRVDKTLVKEESRDEAWIMMVKWSEKNEQL